MDHLAETSTRSLKGAHSVFNDILIQDSTTLTLPNCKALEAEYPSCQKKEVPSAALKVSVQLSLKHGGPQRIEINPENRSEHDTLKLGPWVKGNLVLFDLGFFAYHTFRDINDLGGYFVSRITDEANPTITHVHRTTRGNSIDLVGYKLNQVKGYMKRKVVDTEVEVEFNRKAVQKGDPRTGSFRLVGIMNQETDSYHMYMTNVPPDMLVAEDIANLYRARWEIECVFHQLKQCYSLDKFVPTNPNVVRVLIWTALITLIASRTVHRTLALTVPAEKCVRFTHKRWAKMFYKFSSHLLEWILEAEGIAYSTWTTMEITMEMMEDPNHNRPGLLDDFIEGV